MWEIFDIHFFFVISVKYLIGLFFFLNIFYIYIEFIKKMPCIPVGKYMYKLKNANHGSFRDMTKSKLPLDLLPYPFHFRNLLIRSIHYISMFCLATQLYLPQIIRNGITWHGTQDKHQHWKTTLLQYRCVKALANYRVCRTMYKYKHAKTPQST